MIPELALLKLLFKVESYTKWYSTIDLAFLKQTYREVYKLYQALAAFMLKEQRDTTLDEFRVWFATVYPKENREVYESIFLQLESNTTPEESLFNLVSSIKKKQALQALAVKSFEAAEGLVNMESVETAYNQVLESKELSKAEELTPVNFVSDDLNILINETVKTPGLRWRLKSLNKSLGSLRKGDFGFIFARPETGKTTFLASEIVVMAGTTDKPVVWFNNEEQGSKVMLRCYQATLGLRLEQLISNINQCHEEFHRLTKGNIKIYDQAIIAKTEVESICKQLQPSLVIFDQIDKISGFKADRNDLELGEIYNWARELAKTYAPVIGVCQADGTGDGQKWLTMNNVANAKTSKQAEADWILGIGKQNNEDYEYIRHFNISKNKLFGDEDSIPELRHGRWDVKIKPEVAQYEDYLS